MRILQVFGFFVLFFHGQSDVLAISEVSQANDVVTRGCRNLESVSPLLRLKRHLLCDYDTTVRPNHHKIVTNVTVNLMPKLIEFTGDNGILSLHSWLRLSWKDIHLTWTPSEFDGINFIHIKTYEIWVPDLSVYNSGDMSHDQNEVSLTECMLSSSGSITCVPAMKYISKCETDFTYWPYDKHECRVTFGSWSYTGEEVDFHLDGKGINLDDLTNNSMWDIKFVDSIKQVSKYECCPNDTFPTIIYKFALTRHSSIGHTSHITPAIALMLLTLTVLWLDSRSIERMAMASVNLICHLLCIFDLHWRLPYNGINTPNIMLFYRESLALCTFALILTALLRKLQDITTEMPSWISSTTTFVLSNKAGRFLILNDEESKMSERGIVNEEDLDASKSEIRTKNSSWRYFAAIVEWLSFFCVIFTYIIILITLVPTG